MVSDGGRNTAYDNKRRAQLRYNTLLFQALSAMDGAFRSQRLESRMRLFRKAWRLVRAAELISLADWSDTEDEIASSSGAAEGLR